LNSWLSWAKRCRLEPFKKLARTIPRTRRRSRAGHDRQPLQCLRRGHERLAAAGQARRTRLPNGIELHRHRLLANVQAHDRAERNESPGRAARAEESVKHGVRKTGHAIKHGAQKVGHAVKTGVRKTGNAIHDAGEKMEGTSKTDR
jgi:hypothetical protein